MSYPTNRKPIPDHILMTERWLEAGSGKSGAYKITDQYSVTKKPNWFSRVCKPASQSLSKVGQALDSAFKNYYRLNSDQQFALGFDHLMYEGHRAIHEQSWLVLYKDNPIIHAIAAYMTAIFKKLFGIDCDFVAQLEHAPEIADCTPPADVYMGVFTRPSNNGCPLQTTKPGLQPNDLRNILLQRFIDQPEQRIILEDLNSTTDLPDDLRKILIQRFKDQPEQGIILKHLNSTLMDGTSDPITDIHNQIIDLYKQTHDKLTAYMQMAFEDEILKIAGSDSDSDKQILDSCPEIKEWADSQLKNGNQPPSSPTQAELLSEIKKDMNRFRSLKYDLGS